MLIAENLSLFFGVRPVLRGVSLGVRRGEWVVVLGANGAGKTTLLRVIATLLRPAGGRLELNGVDALTHPARVRAQLGMVSHQPLIYPDLTASENLRFFGRLYGLSGAQLEQRVEHALREVGLWTRRHDRARAFSRGMTQRLSIARAMLHNPDLLLLDEPFTGLDQHSATTLAAMLRDLVAQGRAVLMTTHELGRGLDGVTRALLLKGGRIEAELREHITPEALTALLD